MLVPKGRVDACKMFAVGLARGCANSLQAGAQLLCRVLEHRGAGLCVLLRCRERVVGNTRESWLVPEVLQWNCQIV